LRAGCRGEYLDPKKEEVAGGWTKLHGEELHIFLIFTKYYQSDEINET
jgi:hypothetical protein